MGASDTCVMAIKDKYRFNSDLGELKPTNGAIQWGWRKEDGFFIKELASELRLQNLAGENIFDFDKLYQIVQSKEICEPINLKVDKVCKGGGTTEFFNGYLSIIDGKYDVDKCEVMIKPRSLDGLSCLVDNWEREHNFFDLGDPVTAVRLEGQIETLTCNEDIPNQFFNVIDNGNGGINFFYATNCLPPPDNLVEQYGGQFSVLSTYMTWTGNTGLFENPLQGTLHIETTWVREKWTGSGVPTDGGWKEEGGNYYRRVETFLVDETPAIPGTYGSVFQNYAYMNAIGNGRYLNDVLQNLINQGCNYNIVSNFFGINPDGTEPDNIAYDYAADNTQELILFDKIDAKTLNPDELGTNKPMTLKALWEDLKTIFNLEIRLDEGVLRIEHVSYFENKFMLDLTREDLQYAIKHRGKFEYKKEELPKFERFSWMDDLENSFFDNGTIEYTGVCVDQYENKEILHAVQFISTNVDQMIRTPDKVQDDGFALVATVDHVILRGAPEGIQTGYVNGVLSWDWLFRYVHRWKRKKMYGLMNGVNTQFIGRPKNRSQKDIKVHICCEEIDQFSPDDLVKTQFGWGAVESATYDEPSEILTLNLLHD